MEFDATFLFAAISFVVFVFIMNAIFYSPILKIMKERENVVVQNYKDAETLNKETEKKLTYREEELSKAGEEARKKISELSKTLKINQNKEISEYKSELNETISQTKSDLRQSAIDAKEVLKDKVVDIAGEITGIILGNEISRNSLDKSNIDDNIQG